MLLEIASLGLAILAVLLFFNFYARLPATRKMFGIFAGLWGIILGISLITSGLVIQTGVTTTKDTVEDKQGSEINTTNVINSTITRDRVYEERQGSLLLDDGELYGMFILLVSLFVLIGNLADMLPR